MEGGLVEIDKQRPKESPTDLHQIDYDLEEWNDSVSGEYLWSRNNYGEARPDVMTPLTWSVSRAIYDEISILPGYRMAGNICGRFYANISVMYTLMRSMGQGHEAALKGLRGLLGNVPEDLEIPRLPVSRWTVLKAVPKFMQMARNEKNGLRKVPDFLNNNPIWCRDLEQLIKRTRNKADLVKVWEDDINPRFTEVIWIMGGGYAPYEATMKLKDKLSELVGEEESNRLLSGLSSEGELLASLGPVVGISKVVKGEMSREEYLLKYGHRCPKEMELSAPRPYEDPAWLDNQIEEFGEVPVDVDALLKKQQEAFEGAWRHFEKAHPKQAQRMRADVEGVGPAARMREAVRSELTRMIGLVRAWSLHASELTSLGEDVFFLNVDELIDVLKGRDSASARIPSRRDTYRCFSQLPPYPMIIRGTFDPHAWAADPKRRYDIYDPQASITISKSRMIKGFAGAAGVAEGTIHMLNDPEEGEQLKPGEILLAVTTNVGWTPLFPRAAAVITDVGAPLSHAAIVARELGIPAVVGCGEATTRLKTGDRVRVDGGQGIVEILDFGNSNDD